MAPADALFTRDILLYDTSSVDLQLQLSLLLPPILPCAGVCAQGFIGQASKAATENQEAVKGLNQKEQAVILQVRTHRQ
jgi:hypothetical protein